MNASSTLLVLIAAAALCHTTVRCMAITESWICTPCASQEECDRNPPNLCIWGEARDACNRRICAKGPDERCGGSFNVLGVCGEGMMCKPDERCHGCSIQTMECSKIY
ncbi:neuroparsin-A-like [Anthonomus grandis grandis]|uniref:neuroparsin-A-like n=1 Tax=Anthonomus grandis grandis TaxID=2921223 RepID=UPI002165289D|nr:neuroparsin-A-like [Anthonomus grandis grandis]XP_050296585.1 neuroparsin-A-like [Anthonomus grandis grandis]